MGRDSHGPIFCGVISVLNSLKLPNSQLNHLTWFVELGPGRTGRAGHESCEMSNTWKVVHKNLEDRVVMDYI